MSGDKRAFTFEDNKTTFGYGKDPSEEEFNQYVNGEKFNWFQFNGEVFTKGACGCLCKNGIDPEIPDPQSVMGMINLKMCVDRMNEHLETRILRETELELIPIREEIQKKLREKYPKIKQQTSEASSD